MVNKLTDDSNDSGHRYLRELDISYISKVNGTFHQGDEQFSSSVKRYTVFLYFTCIIM